MPSIKELYSRLNDVKIDADSINLNTDGLESLLATTQADIALIKADMANGVLSDVRDGTGNAITSTTFGSTRRLDVNLSSDGTIGSAIPTSANLYAGSDGTNLRAMSVDSSGRLNANIIGTTTVSNAFATTPAVTSFTSITSATLIASNTSRKMLTIQNTGVGILYVLLGSGTASSTNFSLQMNSGDYYENGFYNGQVNAIFASSGTAYVTSLT
jgi:hypothetical protein